MNPGNYLPATGLMNNGGQAGMMDPYGQGLPAGYNNPAQMQGAFQAMQMPNQMQYTNMRASGSIPQRYAQAPQQPNAMMGGMGQPPNYPGMGQPGMTTQQQQLAAAQLRQQQQAQQAAAAAAAQQAAVAAAQQQQVNAAQNASVPNLRSLAAQRVATPQAGMPPGRLPNGAPSAPQPGAGNPLLAANGAALVNRLGAPMQQASGSAYNPSSELLAMLANAQSNPASLLQNIDPSKLASLDALSMAAATGNPQGISPQVALAHLKQQQALLAAAAGGMSNQGQAQGQPQDFHGDDEFPSLAGGRGQQGQADSMYSQPNGLRTSGSIAVPATQQLQQAAAVLAQQQQQLQQLQQLGAKAVGSSTIGGAPQLSQSAPGMPPTGAAQPPPGQAAVAASDPFGLLGLTRVLKMTDKDLNTLALGTDLTTLGLNLSSPDVLYATFASPWANTPMKRREPEYQIPACYYINPPLPSPTDKMSLFSDETLFYIFYSMPKDALQLASAAELYSREWRYHTELQTWFHRIPGNEPIMKTATYERGSYVYFDVSTWTQTLKDNFVLEYDKLETLPLKS